MVDGNTEKLIDKFLGHIEDISIFDFFGWNIYSVFFDDYQNRSSKFESQIDTRPHSPKYIKQFYRICNYIFSILKDFVICFYFLFKLFSLLLHSKEQRVIYFGFQDRLQRTGGIAKDIYSDRIISQDKRNHYIIIQYYRDAVAKANDPDLVIRDGVFVFRVISLFQRLKYKEIIERQTITIHQYLERIGYNKKDIRTIISGYLSWYAYYRILFSIFKPSKIYYIPFYGHDSIVTAAKSMGILVIELQHGLTDYFLYNKLGQYPERFKEISSRSSRPDELYVWGAYWKKCAKKVNFIPDNKVIIGGYYLMDFLTSQSIESKQQTKLKRKTILITTAGYPFAMYEYIQYLRSKLRKEDWKIVIKPHRNDQRFFNKYSECIEESGYVKVMNSIASPYDMLRIADVHISQLSMLVFEARRYEHITNYVLYLENYAENWEQIIECKVALPLLPNQIPKIQKMPPLVVSDYFDSYKEDLF